MPLALKTDIDIDISTDIDWHRIYISANNRPPGLSAALAWTQVCATFKQTLIQILQESISNQNPVMRLILSKKSDIPPFSYIHFHTFPLMITFPNPLKSLPMVLFAELMRKQNRRCMNS